MNRLLFSVQAFHVRYLSWRTPPHRLQHAGLRSPRRISGATAWFRSIRVSFDPLCDNQWRHPYRSVLRGGLLADHSLAATGVRMQHRFLRDHFLSHCCGDLQQQCAEPKVSATKYNKNFTSLPYFTTCHIINPPDSQMLITS